MELICVQLNFNQTNLPDRFVLDWHGVERVYCANYGIILMRTLYRLKTLRVWQAAYFRNL